jgi:hypothetical protein
MKRLSTVFFALFFTFLYTAAQNIDSTIARYANEYSPEKTYLQYDKSTYIPGETVWFKAYLMDGLYPAETSKTFYTDWTDDKGNLLAHIVSPLQGATTNGQFEIPAEYKGKYIHVKAYTKWMLNFDSAFIYEKDIVVLSANSTGGAKSIITPTLTFFPEGGDAIEGVNNKIAFKVNDQWGKPVKIKGVIKSNQGKTIDSLRVLHDGMGFFFLLPQQGESFTAKWKDEKGTEYTTPLPAIKSSGISLQVAVAGKKRNFSINAPQDIAASLGTVYLLGTINQHEAFKVTKDISTGNASGTIPTQDLPSGILTITVFDKTWKPLAERITYINNEEYKLTAELNVQRWGLNKRARNEIEISVPDSMPSNLSVSVTDADIDTDSSNNIISHLLLTSDIKGQVYNPWYYFSANTDAVNKNLDLVMLTHGWRRFKWDDIVSGKLPKISFPKDTTYLSLSGKVYGVTPSQLRDKAHIILVVSQKGGDGNKIAYLPVEPDGAFNDPSLIFFDTAHIYYQPSKSIKEATLQFMENRLPPWRNRISATGIFNNQIGDTSGYARHFRLSDEMISLLKQYEGKVLENVLIKAKTKTPVQVLDEKYASGMFSGSGDGYQFDLVNDKLAGISPNIFTFLQGKVAGLNINATGSTPTVNWRGGTPLLFLDEMPVDANFLSTIAVSNVAYIKVFRPPFYGASGGSAGAIAIYTRRGSDAVPEPGKGLNNASVSGYTVIRQFYSPNYASFNAANERKDLRTTLYWNPQVVTSIQNNKVLLSFYNNDVTKRFRVIIEGMGKDGRLAHLEQIME